MNICHWFESFAAAVRWVRERNDRQGTTLCCLFG